MYSIKATPWKAINEFRRIILVPLVRAYFAIHGVKYMSSWKIYGLPLIQRHNNSQITIGISTQMRNWFNSNPLGVNHRTILATWADGAVINIGDYVGLTGTTICAESSITIGNHVRFGANSVVTDTDFHPIHPTERLANPKSGKTAPVVIEDDVFIGMHVLILKGSHIGRGSAVGAGSVVSGEVPPGVIVAGNPARVIRELDNVAD